MPQQIIRRAEITSQKHLVLAGGGHAHLAVLESWIKNPPKNLETWLITADPFTAYSGMVPGWMAGHYADGQHLIDLRPLASRAGVRLIIGTVEALAADRNLLSLSSGERVGFDLLSLATGGQADTSMLAALGNRLLPVKPVNEFVDRWPQIIEQAAKQKKFHLVVIGGGAAGIEIAFAAHAALRAVSPDATVTIVSAASGFLAGHARGVIERVKRELRLRRIDICFADAVGGEDNVILSTGKTLAADWAIAATGSKAPAWLKTSGLAVDAAGFVKIGADLRSISHPAIFAAGDITVRIDRPVTRSGVHAVKAGPILAGNLRATFSETTLKAYIPRRLTLYLLATGDKRAILSWGHFTVGGSLVWRLKNWIDRGFVKHYARMGGR